MDPISDSIVGIVGKAIDKIWPDHTQQDMAKLQELQAEITGQINAQLAQIDVDKTEASNANIFVSGWRPFVGWCGGLGLAYDAIVHPLIADLAAISGKIVTLPEIDTQILQATLFGLLGLGVQRTVERIKGVAKGQKDSEMPSYNPTVQDVKKR